MPRQKKNVTEEDKRLLRKDLSEDWLEVKWEGVSSRKERAAALKVKREGDIEAVPCLLCEEMYRLSKEEEEKEEDR